MSSTPFKSARYVRISAPMRKDGYRRLALAECSGCGHQAWRRVLSDGNFERESGCPSCCRRVLTDEGRKQVQKNWHAANRVKVNAWQRRYYSQPHQKSLKANYRLKSMYGITLDEKQAMFDAQERHCKICTEELSSLSTAVVDHSHTTGIIRGLLCKVCNGFVLGLVEKVGPGGLKRAIAYLIEAGESGWDTEPPDLDTAYVEAGGKVVGIVA